MVPLQYINKLFCTLSTFCCGQILYSQIPKEATFPLEIAELIGLKICDNYTLSYFVTNDSVDGRKSYNHGTITQEKEKRGIKFKKAVNHYFDVLKEDSKDEQVNDQYTIIDSIYNYKNKNNYQINVREELINDSYVMHQPKSSSGGQAITSIISVVDVHKKQGIITKNWEEKGSKFKKTIVTDKIKVLFNTTENITTGLKDSVIYNYNATGLLSEVRYNSNNTINRKSNSKLLKFEYDAKNRIVVIKERGRNYHIWYTDNNIVTLDILIGNRKGLEITYLVDDNNYIKSFKIFHYHKTEPKIVDVVKSGDSKTTVSEIGIGQYNFSTHGSIICK